MSGRGELLTGVHLDKSQVLGEGAFGVVYRGRLGDAGVAIKTIKANSPEQAAELEATLLEEAAVWAAVQHPNVVQFYGVHKDAEGGLYLVSELMDGSVEGLLHEDGERVADGEEAVLTERQQLTMCLHVACALRRLHQLKILHSDLAARNVLYKRTGGGDLVFKVTDFGLATVGRGGDGASASASRSYQLVSREQVPVRWCAPEVLKRQLYSAEADVWSLGVYMWEVFSLGELPYGLHMTNADIAQQITPAKSTFRLEQPEECPEAAYQLMHSCWKFGRKLRITLPDMEDQLRQMRDKHGQAAGGGGGRASPAPAAAAGRRPAPAPGGRRPAPGASPGGRRPSAGVPGLRPPNSPAGGGARRSTASPGRMPHPGARQGSPAQMQRPPLSPGRGRMRGSTSSPTLGDASAAAEFYAKGMEATKQGNNSVALEFYRQGAELGHAGAQSALGGYYLDGKVIQKNEELALDLFRKAAVQGDPLGMVAMGDAYKNGIGDVVKSLETAFEWYQKATEVGVPEAFYKLSQFHCRGLGAKLDYQQAFEVATRGTHVEGGGDCFDMMGYLTFNGLGVRKDAVKAISYFQQGAAAGSLMAESSLAIYMLRGRYGVAKNPAKAVEILASAATAEIPSAMQTLGMLYVSGAEGLPKDLGTGIDLMHKAARAEDLSAMARLGLWYVTGTHVQTNVVVGMEMLESSAGQGFSEACLNLGNVAQAREDMELAIEWWTKGMNYSATCCFKAAKEIVRSAPDGPQLDRGISMLEKSVQMGSGSAAHSLGTMYCNGTRVKKSLETGVEWLKKGAAIKDVRCFAALGKYLTDGTVKDRELVQLGLTSLGSAVRERHPGACLRLGELYAKGRYVKTDKALSKKYLLLPAEQGEMHAQFLLGEVSDDLEEPKQAVKWYEKAARQKHTQAAFRLAEHVESGNGATVNLHTAMAWYTRVDTAESHYRQGIILGTGGAGVNVDLKRSTAAFKRAADKGHREACYRLGINARDGVGMSTDKDEAVRLLTKAADDGHAEAAFALGLCYQEGYGNLKKNKKVAQHYFEASAAAGNEKAKGMLKGEVVTPVTRERKSGGLKRLLSSK